MKQRVVTGLVGLCVFFLVLLFYDTLIFNVVDGIIALIAVHELLLALKCTKSIPTTITALVCSTYPFILSAVNASKASNLQAVFTKITPLFYFVIVSVMLLTLLREHEKISFMQTASAMFVAVLVPFSFLSIVMIRDVFGSVNGIYFTLLVFACAWGSDTGAYFAGRFFGKRKLAPKISPNKTVEGLCGGVISCLIFVGLVTVIHCVSSGAVPSQINFVLLAIISIVASLVGVLGDLTASIIKRQCGIKDFGSIIPGHGGIMDRFDSVLFVAPFIFVTLSIVQFIH